MAGYGWTNVTPTTGRVLFPGEVKRYCDVMVTETGHDETLNYLVDAGVETFQKITGAQLLKSVDDFTTDCFPANGGDLYIPRYPLHADGVGSIKYNDTDGTEQTYSTANYVVSSHTMPIRIGLDRLQSVWPVTNLENDAVTVRLTTGYGTASDVPELAKHAILMMVKNWFDHGKDKPIEFGAMMIINQFKMGDAYIQYA